MVRLLLSRPFLHQGSSQAILMTEHSIVFVWVLSLQGRTCLKFLMFLRACSQRQHDELRPISDKGMVTLADNRRTVER